MGQFNRTELKWKVQIDHKKTKKNQVLPYKAYQKKKQHVRATTWNNCPQAPVFHQFFDIPPSTYVT